MTLDVLAMARNLEGRLAIERAVVVGLRDIAGETHRKVFAARLSALDQQLSHAERMVITADYRERKGC